MLLCTLIASNTEIHHFSLINVLEFYVIYSFHALALVQPTLVSLTERIRLVTFDVNIPKAVGSSIVRYLLIPIAHVFLEDLLILDLTEANRMLVLANLANECAYVKMSKCSHSAKTQTRMNDQMLC